MLPIVLTWRGLLGWTTAAPPLFTAMVFSGAILPSYILFALCLMGLSALSTRLTGWRTSPDMQTRIIDMDWALLNWARYMVAIHLVRLFAGTLFRGSPIWTAYLRLNGARMGRRVYVNTLSLSDHNLLDFGDDVVIGADVHLSGHTVEGGVVKTGHVRLGHHVTIGLGSVIEIGVDAGPHCQVGAMSFVPKHAKLQAGALYAGIPAKLIG
jgi:serine acetyltransferase